jgi:anti-sigma28 factor (negative regulator of flagellin synthesis)
MKGYEERRGLPAAHTESGRAPGALDDAETGRHRDSAEERADKIARLKAQVNAGRYEPDVMDIARLLTSAMDPTL